MHHFLQSLECYFEPDMLQGMSSDISHLLQVELMLSVLSPGKHLTLIPGVSISSPTFLTMLLQITRVSFSAGVSLSVENLLETRTDW